MTFSTWKKNNKQKTYRISHSSDTWYVFYLQRYRDSNPDIQSQSLLCYRYTIPLSGILPFGYSLCLGLFTRRHIL